MNSTGAKSRYREAIRLTRGKRSRLAPASRPIWTPADAIRYWQTHFPAMRHLAVLIGQISREVEHSLGQKWREVDVEAFLAEFDPSRSYPQAWWEQKLGTAGFFPGEIEIDQVVRPSFVKSFAFTIPSTEALSAIAEFLGKRPGEPPRLPVIEYFAGRGYWAWLLNREFGVQITATDRNLNDHSEHAYDCSGGGSFVPVHRLDIRNARLPEGFAAMMAWIPFQSDAADRFLKRMRPAEKLIFIGEWGGCCADDSTFEILDKHFQEVGTFPIAQFFGVHDRGTFLVRR